MTPGAEKKIILFDGVCNLCNAVFGFLIDKDREDAFRFAALQSEIGAQLAGRHGVAASDVGSVILIEGDRVFTRSAAALRIARGLPHLRLLYPLMVVPAFFRDAVYDWVARNRYRWFGRREACRLPGSGERDRFLC